MMRQCQAWAVVLCGAALAIAAACGSDKKDDKDTTPTGTSTGTGGGAAVQFTAVNTIIKATCISSGCHGKTGTGSGALVYEDNEANFKKITAYGKTRLNSGKSDTMPDPSAGKVLSDADKTTLLNFLAQ